MLRSARLASLLALTLSLPLSGSAVTIAVPQDQPTIQAAVDAAVLGDVVKVGSGTYNETVVVTKSGITLQGSKSAVISGQGAGVPPARRPKPAPGTAPAGESG